MIDKTETRTGGQTGTTQGDKDNPLVVWSCIIVGTLGYTLFNGEPIMVAALIDDLGYTEAQVGYIASGDFGGMFVSSVLVSLLVLRANRRWLALIGLVMCCIGNLVNMLYTDFNTTLALRWVCGIGSGMGYAVALAILSGTHHAARYFSILIFFMVSTNSVQLYTFPWITEAWGVNGLYFTYAVIFAAATTVIPFIPSRGEATVGEIEVGTDHHHIKIPSGLPVMCLLAVGGYYWMIGVFWAYIEVIGSSLEYSTHFIANFLATVMLIGLIGCYAAYWLAKKTGQSKPYIVCLVIVVSVMGISATGLNPVNYLFLVVTFLVFWNLVDIFQLGVLSNIDHSGRFIALVPAAQGLTMAVSPAVGGFMLDLGLAYEAIVMMMAIAVFISLVSYSLVYRQMKILAPEVADAYESG